MPIGLNRQNDTPIGGAAEFRGNLQNPISVWTLDSVPAWDGEKFAPAANSGLLMGFGGLTSNLIAAVPADGSLIQNWDAVTPLQGSPLQTVVDAVAGTIAVNQLGVYQLDFSANVAGLTNNQEYAFRINLNGVDLAYGAVISGSNSLATAAVGFSIMVEALAIDVPIGVSVTNAGNSNYEVVSASLSVRRIG